MRKALLGATIVAASLLGSIGVAQAGLPPFDYTPTSGPPGTVISASGDCSVFVPRGAQGEVATPQGLFGSVTLELSDNGTTLDTVTDDMNSDGTWALEVTVPPGTSAGTYDLDASCTFPFVSEGKAQGADAPAGQGQVFEYATQAFTVTAQPTSTTAGPTTTTTAGQTTTTVRPAVAAQAVRTAPAFTG